MPEADVQCPLCGSNKNRLFDFRKFHEQQVSNQICLECGLVYQSPRFSKTELQQFYASQYRQLYQGEEGPNPKDLAVQKGRAGNLFGFVFPTINAVTRHLDIGCSAGILLERFRTAYACQPVGVEPGNAYRAYAQAHGLTVYTTLEEVIAAKEPAFDLISLAHVLEHIPDPVKYLVWLRKEILIEAGWLLLEVPNLYAHDSFEVAHLVSFSSHTLVETVKKAGFEICEMKVHGRPRSLLLPLYITLLARPAKTHEQAEAYQVIPEIRVQFKRKLGMGYRRVATRLFPSRAWLKIHPMPDNPL